MLSARARHEASGRPSEKIPGELGIWFFVAGDLIVFAVFFILLAIGQRDHGQEYATAREALDMWVGVLNTVLLLAGSWFVAIGVEKCRSHHRVTDSRYFGFAILCGFAFVLNKSFEWGGKISKGIIPATNEFYMYFFVFTGIHLLHVLVGIGVLFLLRHVSRRGEMSANHLRTLESGGLFWHLVDLLWVVLFAMLYLL